jgi:hypothetical protein
MDFGTGINPWDEHSEGDKHPESEGHDGECQRDAAQHPLAVISEAALSDRTVAGQRCPKPEHSQHGVREPLIGPMQAHWRDDHDAA